MAKYKSINLNPKLIKKGGRKATKTTIDELKEQIVKFARKHLEEDEVDETLDYKPTYEYCPYTSLILSVFGLGETHLNKDVYDLYIENVISKEDFDAFVKEETKSSTTSIYLDPEYANSLIGFYTLDNGFSFLGISGGADYTNPSFFIVYYDGKKIRGYVPKYGNTIIVDLPGFEESSEYWEADETLYKKWFKSPSIQLMSKEDRKQVNELINVYTPKSKKTNVIPLTGPISFNQFEEIDAASAYRLANDYPLASEDINWEAIKTDILNRIEII